MLGHLGFQRMLDEQLGQVLEEPILADQIFRFLVSGQQASKQFFRYVVSLLVVSCQKSVYTKFCTPLNTDARKDSLHKLSTRLINENQVIAVETLAVSNMQKNRCLSKAIGDAGQSEFVR